MSVRPESRFGDLEESHARVRFAVAVLLKVAFPVRRRASSAPESENRKTPGHELFERLHARLHRLRLGFHTGYFRESCHRTRAFLAARARFVGEYRVIEHLSN